MAGADASSGGYRQLFEAFTDAVFVYDPDTATVVDANPAAAELTGYAVGTLTGRPVTQFGAGAPETIERATAAVVDRAAEADRHFEWLIERADGQVRTVDVTLHRTAVDGEDRVLAIMCDVTDREPERAAREEHRERLAALTESNPDVFWMFSPDWEACLYVNEAYETVWGRSTGALKRDPTDFLAGVHPDDRAQVRTAMDRLSNGSRVTLEFRVNEGADFGRWVWVEGVPIFDDAGELTRIVGFARDVTKRKRLEETLQARTEELSALTDNLPLVLFELDADGVFRQSRGRGLRALGREPGQVVGHSIFDVYADNEAVLDACRRALAGESVKRTVEMGDLVFDAWYEPTVDDEGSVDGVIGVAVDVTERERVQAELEANERALRDLHTKASRTDLPLEERLRRLLDIGRERLELPLGFVTHIREGTQHIVEAQGTHEEIQAGASAPLSEAYCRRTIEGEGLLGVRDAPAEGWEGDPAYERFGLNCYLGGKLVVDDELYGTVCFASRTARGREFSASERAFVELLVQWLGYELERDRHEAALQARERELQRQNEQLEEFADVVAHDIRGPLTAAVGFFELARSTDDEAHFAEVERAHARMERLIDDLLTLARQGRSIAEREPVDLGDVARAAWPYVRGEATLDIEAGLPDVEGDASRLEAVFGNLFRNAVDHGGPGVAVRIGPLERDQGFFVEDDGPGVPPGKRPHVFDFGYTTSTRGTGLGLAIVQEVVEAHGWTVSVTDGSDGGARFEIRTGDPVELPPGVAVPS
ncbi:MAG: PAS domain S-box protein [Halobacteriales archaeon]